MYYLDQNMKTKILKNITNSKAYLKRQEGRKLKILIKSNEEKLVLPDGKACNKTEKFTQ